MARRSFYVKDSELDDYQVKVINNKIDTSHIVKGCAGSGKSILALWKAKQIQDQKKGSYLVIVFTKALREYIADGISQVGISQKNVYYLRQWEKAGCPRADYILVDEAQDFSEDDIKLFYSKARKSLFLYGDSAQQVYEFRRDKEQPLSMEDIEILMGFPMDRLERNHRLPKKIARLAEYLNSENDDLVKRCTREGIEKPKIIEYDNINDQYDAIISLIRNKNMEDVGILFRYNAGVEQAYDYFKQKGVNVERKVYQKMDLDFSSDNPKMMTYHSSKGLQFEHVFIPECTVEDYEDRNLLYVAITRTYGSLYIMHSGNLSSFFDAVPTSLYDTSLTSGPKLTIGGLSTPRKPKKQG